MDDQVIRSNNGSISLQSDDQRIVHDGLPVPKKRHISDSHKKSKINVDNLVQRNNDSKEFRKDGKGNHILSCRQLVPKNAPIAI